MDEIFIEYNLPMAGDNVSSDIIVSRSVVAENNCILCNLNEDVAYTYDECTLMCQSVTTSQTICTYTDIEGTIESMTTPSTLTALVNQDVCCANAGEDLSL